MAKGHRSQIKRERNSQKILDLQQSYLMLECQFRKSASY